MGVCQRKIVLMDLDDTILDFHTAERTAITDSLESLGIAVNEELFQRYSEINAWCWQQLELGEMTRAAILVERFRMLFAERALDCSPAEAQSRYEKLLQRGHYFVPGAEALLETLFPLYDLYIISNGNIATQESRLKSARISHYFKKIFISELIGFNKPSPAFFEACFAEISDFRKEDAVIVGDSLSSDIRGGRNMGITTCWFNPGHLPARADIRADYEFSALAELPALLKHVFNAEAQ